MVFLRVLFGLSVILCFFVGKASGVSRDHITAEVALGFGHADLASGTVHVQGWSIPIKGGLSQSLGRLSGCMISPNVVLTTAHAPFLFQEGVNTFVWIGPEIPQDISKDNLWYEVMDTRLYLQNHWVKMECNEKRAASIAENALLSRRDLVLLRLKTPLRPDHAKRVRIYEIGDAAECDLKREMFATFGYSNLVLCNGSFAPNPKNLVFRRHGFLVRGSLDMTYGGRIPLIQKTSQKLPGSFYNFEASKGVSPLFDGNSQPGDSGGPFLCFPKKPGEREKLIAISHALARLGKNPHQTNAERMAEYLQMEYPHLPKSQFTKAFIDHHFTWASGEAVSVFLTLDHFRPWIQEVLFFENKRLLGNGGMAIHGNAMLLAHQNFWAMWHKSARRRVDLLADWGEQAGGSLVVYGGEVERLKDVSVSSLKGGLFKVRIQSTHEFFEGIVSSPFEGQVVWFGNPKNPLNGLSLRYPRGSYETKFHSEKFKKFLMMFFKMRNEAG